MRVGVIRGDMPGPVFVADLESVSQYNPPTEPRGQNLYLGRPTVAEVEAALADPTTGAGATIEGGTISFNLTITGSSNDDLRLKTSAGAAFVTYTIAAATYTTLTDLIAAVNAAIAGSGITARENIAGDGIALESDTKGVDSYIELDTDANGSNANGDLALPDGDVRDMPSAADFIADLLPVGGPLDVSTSTIEAVGAGDNANALSIIPSDRGTVAALADAVAPRLAETPVVEDSYLVGMISELRSASFNPDSNRLSDGAAIEVVEDDGSTPFTLALPNISAATLDSPGAGDVTIDGTNLASVGDPTGERKDTYVTFFGTGTPGDGNVKKLSLSQELIEANGGTVTATEIVVPAVLNTLGFATTTTTVQVQHRSHVSNVEALA